MIRILIFLLFIVFFAGTITILASLDSRITGEAFGYRFDGPSGLILGGLAFLFLAVIYVTHAVKNILAIPGKLKAREKEARRSRGVAALTRGLEAVAAGDAADASHHARVARRHLDDMALTRLLSAQAAQLSGDAVAAESSFSAMLEAPETEFLGLKGLYLQAMKAGERERAMQYAERAYRLRPNAQWAFESVFELGLQRGAWRETREALMQARRNNVVPADKADRAAAALLTADAYAAALTNEPKLALTEAEAALKRAPGFSPAAALAARLHAANNKTAKAAKIIEAAFAADPHPALVKAYNNLYADEDAASRADLLRKLAAKNPASYEAALLRARAHLLEGGWREAAEALEAALTDAPGPAAFSLMAEAAAGLHGSDAARPWLERAAGAPRDPRPGADGEFHFTRDGWALMVREYMEHARLAPPPLEETGQGAMSVDEVHILLAPPVKRITDKAAGTTGLAADGRAAEDQAGQHKEDKPKAEESGAGAPAPDRSGRASGDAPADAPVDAQVDALSSPGAEDGREGRDAAAAAAAASGAQGASSAPDTEEQKAPPASVTKETAVRGDAAGRAGLEETAAAPAEPAAAAKADDDPKGQAPAASDAPSSDPAPTENAPSKGVSPDRVHADGAPANDPSRNDPSDDSSKDGAATKDAPGGDEPLTDEERLARAAAAAGKTP